MRTIEQPDSGNLPVDDAERALRAASEVSPSAVAGDASTEQETPPQTEAQSVCWEAYQVVGSLLMDLGQFGTERADNILDNLSEARMVHDDVLPWPSFSNPTIDELRAQRDALVEAADALLSNEEHAVSGGMRKYQKGSPTWQLWEDLRTAARAALTRALK
jgi:hypothetical protein